MSFFQTTAEVVAVLGCIWISYKYVHIINNPAVIKTKGSLINFQNATLTSTFHLLHNSFNGNIISLRTKAPFTNWF